MTRVWRIGPRAFAPQAVSGIGGTLVDGRWHHAGRRIVYTAQSLSLAALEVLVRVRSVDNVRDLVAQHADIDDEVPQDHVNETDLPNDWSAPIAGEATKMIGDDWLKRCAFAVLWVPSAVTQGEHNALLNPAHAAFAAIVFSEAEPYTFDARLLRRS